MFGRLEGQTAELARHGGFYVNRTTAERRSRDPEVHRKKQRVYRASHLEEVRARDAEYRARPEVREARIAYLKAWRKSPEGKAKREAVRVSRAEAETPEKRVARLAYLKAWRETPEGRASKLEWKKADRARKRQARLNAQCTVDHGCVDGAGKGR
jgi:hypothetical protein